MREILLDGQKLDFLNKEILIDGDVVYNFTDNSKNGFYPFMIKRSQFNEMLKSNRIKFTNCEGGEEDGK